MGCSTRARAYGARSFDEAERSVKRAPLCFAVSRSFRSARLASDHALARTHRFQRANAVRRPGTTARSQPLRQAARLRGLRSDRGAPRRSRDWPRASERCARLHQSDPEARRSSPPAGAERRARGGECGRAAPVDSSRRLGAWRRAAKTYNRHLANVCDASLPTSFCSRRDRLKRSGG